MRGADVAFPRQTCAADGATAATATARPVPTPLLRGADVCVHVHACAVGAFLKSLSPARGQSWMLRVLQCGDHETPLVSMNKSLLDNLPFSRLSI